MKRKGIILSIIGIIVVSVLLIILVNENVKNTFMQDGVMFALTLDGESTTSFPERGKYSVSVSCENGEGIWLPEEWKLVVEDIKSNVSCNVDFTSTPKTLISEVESKANTNANGYRYSGMQPNNYIWFNNEMWRIIGSIPTKQSDGITANLVKIIRNEPIGGLSYDAKSSGYTGAWGSNTLYTHLNTHYYATSEENLNGQNSVGCYGSSNEAKANCNYTDIGLLSTSYYGSMVENVYWNTGASSKDVTASEAYTNETAIQTVQGYIGLMSASDYGYAADSSYHSTSMYSYNPLEITSTNWLYNNGIEWTSIQYSSLANSAMNVYYAGNVVNSTAYNGYAVRPVLYLNESTYVINGDEENVGSISNPYQIAI